MKDLSNRASELAKTLADYRPEKITKDRILSWVQVFRGHRQEILAELNHIFQKYFWTKDRIKKSTDVLLRSISKEAKKHGLKIEDVIFMRTQEPGKSQSDILDIADSLLYSANSIHIDECGGGTFAAYLDDCSFTGNRMRRDIEQWLPGNHMNVTHLRAFLVGYHTKGWSYVSKKISESCNAHNVSFQMTYIKQLIDTGKVPRHLYAPSDVYNVTNVMEVKRYLEHLKEEKKRRNNSFSIFRPPTAHIQTSLSFMGKCPFSSHGQRALIESHFLIRGCELHHQGLVNNANMRPMGYHFHPSLGFGTIIATYRNIANNAPLALWWSAQGQTPLFEPSRG